MVALATPVLVLAVLVWRNRNLYDDGFIYLRVVDNILHATVLSSIPANGSRPTTGPLWLAILAIAGLLPVAWVACGRSGHRIHPGRHHPRDGRLVTFLPIKRQGERPFLLPLGAITFVVLPPVWVYASTGLETGLTFCWLAGCLAALTWWAKGSTRLAPWGLVLIGLRPLVRPELVWSQHSCCCLSSLPNGREVHGPAGSRRWCGPARFH